MAYVLLKGGGRMIESLQAQCGFIAVSVHIRGFLIE